LFDGADAVENLDIVTDLVLQLVEQGFVLASLCDSAAVGHPVMGVLAMLADM
jgi:hypothetical protein